MNLLYNYITNNKSPPPCISSERGPPSCRNARGRGCGRWNSPPARVSSKGGVVVASVTLKREREGLWWMDDPSVLHFE